MNQVTRTEAIKRFLLAKTHYDLAMMYSPEMECQVNVAQDGGQRVDSEFRGRQWQAWSNGLTTWASFRIPHNASTEPEYKEKPMFFNLEEHAEAIGMTGWDWANRISKWVAFDFDAITGHSEKHEQKLTTDELNKIQEIATKIPWVTVRRSTGGKGLHLYVFLNDVPTANHTEHAAIGRAVLGKLSALTGHDFSTKVDVCGGNIWVWRRTLQLETGLKLIKRGETLIDIPPNWRDHIGVVTGRKRKARASVLSSTDPEDSKTEAERLFEELTSQRPKIPLDEVHTALVKFLLEDNQTGSWWDADRHMLVTHTWWLQKAHEELNLRGIFKTKTIVPEAHNCFCYPLRRGAWSVRRYTPGVQEELCWSQDANGYTHILYNHEPDLPTAARAFGAVEDPKGGFVFRELEVALQAAKVLGANLELPQQYMSSRRTKLKPHKDGRLVIEFDKSPDDTIGKDWLAVKDTWKRVVTANVKPPAETEVGNFDDLVRHLVTQTGEDYGWVIKSDGNQWRTEPLVHVQAALGAQGLDYKEVKLLMGQSVMRAWVLVNKPFKEEYPGDREWNRGAAQLRFLPNITKEDLHYPTWAKILNHIGNGLDDAIKNDGWCRANGIASGGEYLKVWLASLFKEPLQPLPYLFLYGPGDSGKSTLHEAIHLLITKGVVRADNALIQQAGFNGELEGAVCCVVEEVDLRRSKDANNRIKDWVTARQLPIHRKQRTPYHVENSTHWIQCSNEATACPIFPGDTRITMIYVGALDPLEMIPKRHLHSELEKEAPDFLAALLRLELPPVLGRLNIPVITTQDKIQSEKSNQTPVASFLEDKCHYAPGSWIKYGELYDAFVMHCDPCEVNLWNKKAFGAQLPRQYPKGRDPSTGFLYVGNISFEQPKGPPKPKLIAKERKGELFLVPDATDDNKRNS
jgi:hypothetical protein